MILTRIQPFIKRMIAHERSPRRLALTCALGIYIGISPFVGLHTAMIFIFGWTFALSIPVLFTVSVLIHNPWTMMPVYAIDHLFGKWLFTTLGIDYLQWDPTWIEAFNLFLQNHTGIAGLSLSAFFIGGNVLAVSTSVMMYPLMKRIFTKYLSESSGKHQHSPLYQAETKQRIKKQRRYILPTNSPENI
jgi:uncharacterized protein (DUF2062 family)